jgi:hypothetical protein
MAAAPTLDDVFAGDTSWTTFRPSAKVVVFRSLDRTPAVEIRVAVRATLHLQEPPGGSTEAAWTELEGDMPMQLLAAHLGAMAPTTPVVPLPQ